MKRFVLTVACLAIASGAYAQTLSFEFDFDEAVTEISQRGNLGLFNSNLGTLTGASLELFGSATTSITLTNNAAQPQTVTATGTSDLSFTSNQPASLPTFGAGIPTLHTILTGLAPLTVSIPFPEEELPDGETTVLGPLNNTNSVTLNLASILADLQAPGGGLFSITGTSFSGFDLDGSGGNINSSQTTTAGIGAKITYTYTPFAVIPEPSQAISTLALCTFGLMLRRRASKR